MKPLTSKLMGLLLFLMLLSFSTKGEAVLLQDTTADGALFDGTINSGEYVASTNGTGGGGSFGLILTAGQYFYDADVMGNLQFALQSSIGGPCDPDYHIVIYIDSKPGGPESTAHFVDTTSGHRAAVSGASIWGSGFAEIVFPSDFRPDYAISIDCGSAWLWELQSGGLNFIKLLSIMPEIMFSDYTHELSGLHISDLGMTQGDTFKFFITLINPWDPAGANRSNEFHGFLKFLPSADIGPNPLFLEEGEYSSFQTPYVEISEVDVDMTGTDTQEFVELRTAPGGLDLSGLSLVMYNGADDASYDAYSLNGHSSDASGFFVAGNSGVTGVDIVIPDSGLQNGADAVALHFEDVSSFPTDTPISTGSLVDALVYGTDDPDDTGLLALISPGEPQVNESGAGDPDGISMQRCGGSLGETSGYILAPPTPGAENVCSYCGNGTVDSGEVCDDLGATATCDSDCTAPACGDGYLNPFAGEDCDDGGESATCNSDCTLSSCGDGVPNTSAGEACDDGGESASCNVNCTLSSCGDGITNTSSGEECDDGSETANCNGDCTFSFCGDGVVNATAGEQCDDAGESENCNISCTMAQCGDGVTNTTAGEECDDGGESPQCDTDCTVAQCGDGVTNSSAGEECDDGVETANCSALCQLVFCGNGIIDAHVGEICDDGGESASCDTDCTLALCGDGVTNTAAGEECDDGSETATCDGDCTDALCGDGVINTIAGEACDDGEETATCDVDCTEVSCGDGVINSTAGEECDDGGESETCNTQCAFSRCGDGVINSTAGEECDDGEESAVCDSDCTNARCGDGVLNTTANEVCDDGEDNSDTEPDACRSNCTAPYCGDGVLDTGESCDEGSANGPQGTCTENCELIESEDGSSDVGSDCSCHVAGARPRRVPELFLLPLLLGLAFIRRKHLNAAKNKMANSGSLHI